MSETVHNLMQRASQAYYNGEPIMTNDEYDALERLYGQLISGEGDIPHLFRMYSLQKHYDSDGAMPLPISQCFKSQKYDGAAVDVTYVDGKFVRALTRGDGIKGRDITDKIKHLVPDTIPFSTKPTQITGEVVARNDVENSRNYASGALNLKSMDEYLSRVTDGKMIFIAYNVQCNTDRWGLTETYKDDLVELRLAGFNTVVEDLSCTYPTDGIVYRYNDNNAFNNAGFTDKHPRGAFAHKEEQEAVITTLLDVVWETGKSGVVAPTALLEPVMIGDAVIQRATLNNIAYIEALDLELGCQVQVIRAGEIIPKIIGRHYE